MSRRPGPVDHGVGREGGPARLRGPRTGAGWSASVTVITRSFRARVVPERPFPMPPGALSVLLDQSWGTHGHEREAQRAAVLVPLHFPVGFPDPAPRVSGPIRRSSAMLPAAPQRAPTAPRGRPPGRGRNPRAPRRRTRPGGLFDPVQLVRVRSFPEALGKLHPRALVKNPVLVFVAAGSVLTTLSALVPPRCSAG